MSTIIYYFTCKKFVSNDPDAKVASFFTNHCQTCGDVFIEADFTTLINKVDAHFDSVIQEHGYMDNLNEPQYFKDISSCISSKFI